MPQHYPEPATNERIASIVDWTPEGEKIRIDGPRFPDYRAAWEASRAMPQARREAQREETR